jgi:hypothetical protein
MTLFLRVSLFATHYFITERSRPADSDTGAADLPQLPANRRNQIPSREPNTMVLDTG